jgi:hypothetical protein
MRGSAVKIFGKHSRAEFIHFINHDFTGYTVNSGPITWIEADTAYSCTVKNAFFDDAQTAGVTHAPIMLTDSEFWTIEDVTTNIGTAAGGDTTAAALIHCGFSNGQPLEIGNVRLQGRTTPWFSGNTITDIRRSPKSAISTTTPGAVSTVNIAHGLGYTPRIFQAERGDVNARGAPAYHVTADGTNVILNFASNLTGATAYTWNWTAG